MNYGKFHRIFSIGMLILVSAVLFPLAHAGAAQNGPLAANINYEVNTLADDGQGSLRQAIIAANGSPGKDTITFALEGLITLESTLPTIDEDLEIDGGGMEIEISGDQTFRVMQVAGASTVLEINELYIASGVSLNENGAAILNDGAEVIVTKSSFTGNKAKNGGAIYNQGGAVVLTDVHFFANEAFSAGALYNDGGTITVTSSTFSGGFSSFAGAIINSGGTLNISNSTFFMNQTLQPENAVFTGTVVNVSDGETVVINSTFSENDQGGFYNLGGTVIVRNTILDDADDINCQGLAITNGGNNIDSGTTCGWAANNGSQSNTDPDLAAALALNGGPTPTLALLPGSPAIDAVVNNAPNQCPAADQRGVPRPFGAFCDAGAFEMNQQSGPNFVVNVLADETGPSNDGSCDVLVPDVTDCTLREAMVAANLDPGMNTITFSVSGSIILNDILPTVGSDLHIDGSGQSVLVDGSGNFSIFKVIAGDSLPVLEISDLGIESGNSAVGAGIYNDGAEVIVNNSSLRLNVGGAIYNRFGALSVNGVYFDKNTADSGGAIFTEGGTTNVADSTFSFNEADAGAAIHNASGPLSVLNSTFYNNDSAATAALVNAGGISTVTNSTFSEDHGASVAQSGGTLTLRNTIVDSLDDNNCSGAITNGGNNIDSGATCGWAAVDGSQSSTDPLLAAVMDNGGLWPTAALLPGSPAIDAVVFNAPNECPATDQRGVLRPQGDFCDSGAFEREMDLPPEGSVIYMGLILSS